MTTLILGGMTIEDPQILKKAAELRGWKVVEIQGSPSTFTDGFKAIKDPVIYAAPGLAERMAAALNVDLITVQETWLSNLPFQFTRRDIQLSVSTKHTYESLTYPKFIKPCTYKKFPAKVYNDDRQAKAACRDALYYGPIYIQEPVEWEVEYRCFISNNKLQTLAPYKRNMKTDKYTIYQEEVDNCYYIVQQMAEENCLPVTGTLDIGFIKNRGWAVVELNGAYGSGIYKLTNVNKVLDVLQATTVPRSKILN